VFVYTPATAGDHTHAQLTQKEIIDRVQKAGVEVFAIEEERETLGLLEKELRADDVVLLMTSGNLGGLTRSIPKLVEKLFPK